MGNIESAIRRDNLPLVNLLISRRSVDINAPLTSLETRAPPLVFAAQFGRTAIVAALLKAGANVNGVDMAGKTACHVAAWRGDVDTLTVLLAHAPDLGLLLHGRSTALEYAIDVRDMRRFNVDTARMLIEAGAPLATARQDLLCKAAARSAVLAQALLDRGIAVSALRNLDGRSPVMLTGDLELLDMLVTVCGCDLAVRDSEGSTIAHVFAFAAGSDCIRWLIDAEVDLNVPNNVGRTPLHKFRSVDTTLMILAGGANVHARDMDGNTACHVCATETFVSARGILHALLAGGADLDALNHGGFSPRQLVTERGWSIDPDEVASARRRLARVRLDLVRQRALQVCIALQSRGLDALTTCEILVHACGSASVLIPFHQWWAVATTVKHFQQ